MGFEGNDPSSALEANESSNALPHELAFMRQQQALLEQTACGAPLGQLLDGIVGLIEAQSADMLCSILLLDREARVLRHGSAPRLPEAYTRAIDGSRIGPDAGSCGAAAYRAEVVEVADIATHPNWVDYRHLALPHGLLACWSSPILSPEREVLGTFAMYYRETRLPRDDERRWVAAATHLARIAIQASRTREMEAALLRREAELRAIFDHTAIGIGVIGLDFTYLLVNPALCEMLGYSADELIGKAPSTITHPDDWERDADLATELREGRRASLRLEKRYLRKDGTLVWGRLTSSLVRDATGEPLFVVSMVEDITAQKRLEGEVLRSQHLDGLSRLASGIAHDFNNVLTAIHGSAAAALDDLDAAHPARAALHDIEAASNRATDLVRRILAFSPGAEPQRVLQPLGPIVREAARLVGAKLPSHTTIHEDLRDDVWVHGDATQLQQLVMNLVINATQAVAPGGTVTLRLEDTTVDASVEATVGYGRWARLVVADDGVGIAPDHLPEVFEPFFTTRPQGQGSGLGLAIVRAIAAAHDGSVCVASQLGRGSTFEAWLPAAAAPVAAAPAPTRPKAQAPGSARGRVLVIDDEPLIGRLAKRELSRVGFEVEVFDDPEQALRAFLDAPGAFDAVVTDAAMPRLSGFELARAIKARRPAIPIVVISGGLWNRESLEELGVSELLLKPEALRELAPTVRRLLQT